MQSTETPSGVARDATHPPEEFEVAPPPERPRWTSMPTWGDGLVRPESDGAGSREADRMRHASSKREKYPVAASAPGARGAPGGPRQAGPPVLTLMLWLGAAAGLFYTSWTRDLLIGQVGAVAIGLGGLHGLWRGGLRKIVMLPLLAAVAYAVVRLPASLGLPGALGYIVAGVIGLAALSVGVMTVKRMRRRLVEGHPMMHRLERCAGLLVGAAEGALIPLSICWAAVAIRPAAADIEHSRATGISDSQRQTAAMVVRLADETVRAGLGEIVRSTNPIDRIAVLRDTVRQLNETGKIELDQLDPETRQRVEDLLRMLPDMGALDGVSQSQSAAEHRHEQYENMRRQLDRGR